MLTIFTFYPVRCSFIRALKKGLPLEVPSINSGLPPKRPDFLSPGILLLHTTILLEIWTYHLNLGSSLR
jgi:hypothetical protein